MTAILVTEIHADNDRVCAYLSAGRRLATARRGADRGWQLQMDGQQYRCMDLDDVRWRVRAQMSGQAVAFERRTIRPRHHYHGRLSAAEKNRPGV